MTLGENQSEELLQEFFNSLLGSESKPDDHWQEFSELHRKCHFPFAACLEAWQKIYKDLADHSECIPCWIPDSQRVANSNIHRWMTELGMDDVKLLHHWSKTSRDAFWEMAIEELDIVFRQEPTGIFDLSGGIQSPRLLPGSRLNIVESCFQATKDQVAVISGAPDGQLDFHSYGELRSKVNQVSNALIEAGLGSGDRVGVVMPMSFDSTAIYLGIVQAGMVVVSIADSFASAEISNRLTIADAKAVFAYERMLRSGKLLDLGERVQNATDLPIFFVDQDSKAPSFNWRERVKHQSTEFEPLAADPHDPINILFSSGTTGEPKAIPWNQTTPIKCATDGHLHHDLQQGDVVAWPTNLGWMMGPWLIFATLINKGTIAIYDDAPLGSGFGKFIQDAKVNMLGLVPSIVRLWKRQKNIESFDWSAIKSFSSTGEASNAGDMFYLSWLADFKPVIEYCGGTEIGGGYISSTVVEPNVPAAFSTPAFGLDVQIVNETSDIVKEGELFISPPSIGLSVELLNRDHQQAYYLNCPLDNNGLPLRRHGDFFRQLESGYFIAGGRTDDTMNLGGIKVGNIEIEKVINQLKQVTESAAVAVPLDRTGPDQLVVFYVGNQESAWGEHDELMQEMNEAIRANLNPLFKVKRIVPKDALPRTASNKVMRRVLRDELLTRE